MTIKLSNMEVDILTFGTFRLDGGSMFGSVPKNIWNRMIKADDENCIPLASRSLLIKTDSRKILVDVGLGDKWDDKKKGIFNIRNTPTEELTFDHEQITDVILTHLHFDHAGGISRYNNKGEVELCYPNATIHLQDANWKNACHPGLKEKASYLKENVFVIENKLNRLNGATELFPGISVIPANGHTEGQQIVRISDNSHPDILFPTDLVPTSHHIHPAFHMGYDVCASTVLKEKKTFSEDALKNNSIIVFQHDPEVETAVIKSDEKKGYTTNVS